MPCVHRAALGLLLGLALGCCARAADSDHAAWLARAERREQAGWIYLHLEGTPQARGFQHGYLLAPEIAAALRTTRAEWRHTSGLDWDWLIAHTKGFVESGIDAEDRAELGGLVEGLRAAGVATNYDELVTYNATIELTAYWWPLARLRLLGGVDSVAPLRDACSAFIATGRMTRSGQIVMGHNTMSDYADPFPNVIVDLVPSKGHRILMQTQPGWIHSGTDFFVTDAGLVGCETTLSGLRHFSEEGIPEFVRMRRATQEAGDLDRWCAVMKHGNNGGYANAWLLGDVATGEIARLELGLHYVGFERTKDGYFTGSNLPEDRRLLRVEAGIDDTDIRLSGVVRRLRWQQLMRQYAGRIDLAVAKLMEGDTVDGLTGRVAPSGRTLAGHNELDLDPVLGHVPFDPHGSIDAKVIDSAMARAMSFAARWGSAEGQPFEAAAFLAAHPQFDWLQGLLISRPAQPWTVFTARARP